MAEEKVTSSWRSVKIEAGTQKTFSGGHHAAFVSTQYEALKDFGAERLHIPAGLMAELEQLVKLERDASDESTKSPITAQLKAKDAERDEALRHIFGIIRAQLYSSVKAERDAAQMLDVKLHNFRYIRHRRYNVESSSIESLLLDAEVLTAEIEALRLKPSFEWLEEANEAYKKLAMERVVERTAKQLPSLRKLRPQSDELYELACQYVQASYLFAETETERDEIERLVRHMNQTVREFKASHRKSVSQKKRHKKEKEGE